MEIEENLKKIIGKSGKVSSFFGGFLIMPSSSKFPWKKTLTILLEHKFRVYASIRHDKLSIIAKP